MTVRENEFSSEEFCFPGHVWLDDHIGDCKTERKLPLLGKFVIASIQEATGSAVVLPASNAEGKSDPIRWR